MYPVLWFYFTHIFYKTQQTVHISTYIQFNVYFIYLYFLPKCLRVAIPDDLLSCVPQKKN